MFAAGARHGRWRSGEELIKTLLRIRRRGGSARNSGWDGRQLIRNWRGQHETKGPREFLDNIEGNHLGNLDAQKLLESHSWAHPQVVGEDGIASDGATDGTGRPKRSFDDVQAYGQSKVVIVVFG